LPKHAEAPVDVLPELDAREWYPLPYALADAGVHVIEGHHGELLQRRACLERLPVGDLLDHALGACGCPVLEPPALVGVHGGAAEQLAAIDPRGPRHRIEGLHEMVQPIGADRTRRPAWAAPHIRLGRR